MPEEKSEEKNVEQQLNPIQVSSTEAPLNSINQSIVRSLFAKSQNEHFLAGATHCEEHPVVLFQLREHLTASELTHAGFLIWAWPDFFGAGLSISAFLAKRGFISRAWFRKHTPELSAIGTGTFKALFAFNNRPIAAFEVSVASSSRRDFAHQIDSINLHTPTLDDEQADYWRILGSQDYWMPALSKKDKLSIGWAHHYNKIANCVLGMIDEYASRPLLSTDERTALPKAIQSFLGILETHKSNLSEIVNGFKVRYGTGESLQEILNALEGDSHKELFWAIMSLVDTHSEFTDCGHRLRTFEGNLKRNFVEIAPDEFPSDAKPEDYWNHLPPEPFLDFHLLVTASSFPLSLGEMVSQKSTFPIAEDHAKVNASADALWELAVSNKRGTIPRGAIVEPGFGCFERIEVFEIDDNVFFVCRNSQGFFYVISCEPKKHYCSFHFPCGCCVEGQKCDSAGVLEITAAVTLHLAAIVHDFWVVEERDKVFAHRLEKSLTTRHGRSETVTRIVYIPRVRYSSPPDYKNCDSVLNLERRREHFVQAHLRKSADASEHQIFLAMRYGFSVPKGYTFVRPHQRGKEKAEVIYRSRSALRSLYTKIESTPSDGAPDRWFTFERDVHHLLQHAGFTVVHVSASRHGDSGVDVYATKGNDLDQVNWIVQCKCWRPSRRIGPSVVRELVGALSTYPQGTRGMIVTTSSFTDGARQFAHTLKQGVRIEELLSRVNFQLYVGGQRVATKQEWRSLLEVHERYYISKEARAAEQRKVTPYPLRQSSFYKKNHGVYVFDRRMRKYLVPLMRRLSPAHVRKSKLAKAQFLCDLLIAEGYEPLFAPQLTPDLVRKTRENPQHQEAYVEWKRRKASRRKNSERLRFPPLKT